MNEGDVRIVTDQITREEIKELANQHFGDMAKAVVDLGRDFFAIGGEMHADLETMLLEHGSKQADLCGINLYPGIEGDSWIEFDSMINIRPGQGNRSRRVEHPDIQHQIIECVARHVA